MKRFIPHNRPSISRFCFIGLALGWMAWVARQYFVHHPEYLASFESVLNRGIFITGPFIGYFFFAAIIHWIRGKRSSALNLSTRFGIIFVPLSILLLGALCYFHIEPYEDVSFIPAMGTLAAKVLVPIAFIFFPITVSFGVGKRVLRGFEFQESISLDESLLCIATGMASIGLLLGLLAFAGWFTSVVLWPLFLILAAMTWREGKRFISSVFNRQTAFTFRFFSLSHLLWILFLFGVALNLLDLVRPIPTGWDDLGRYMNHPKVLADTGRLPTGNPGWPWEIWMALGFGMLDSIEVSMMISYAGVPLSCLGMIGFTSRFLNSTEAGLVAAAVFSYMPLTMHQSFTDMKVDMGLLFFLTMSIYALFRWFDCKDSRRWLMLSGILMGTAFAVKITATFTCFAVLIAMAFSLTGPWGALFVFGIELWIGIHSYGHLIPDLTIHAMHWIKWVCVAVSAFSLVALLMQRNGPLLMKAIKAFCLFFAGIALAASPWCVKGFIETESAQPLDWLSGKESTVQVDLASLGIDPAQCSHTAGREEMTRYVGYDEFASRYLELPWRMTMNTHVQGSYVDISFLYLAITPALGLLLSGSDRSRWSRWWKILVFLGMASWFFWTLFASGVPWYNIFGFFPLAACIGGALVFAQNKPFLKTIFAGLVIIALLSMFVLRVSQFGTKDHLRYALGAISAEEVIERKLPLYQRIARTIEMTPPSSENPNHVYKIGTFLRYFIKDNLRRVFDDPQLDTFTSIDGARIDKGKHVFWEPRDDRKTLDRLRRLGFRFIILDLNMASIEKDPNGTLHQKANRFVEFANKNLRVLVNDPSSGIAFMEIP